MDRDKVDMYVVTHSKFFPIDKIPTLKETLLQADDSKYALIMSVELKDPTVIMLISIFTGYLGIDRFMLGDIPMGILKLCTLGLCYILYIVDWFLVQNKTKVVNYKTIMSILA